MDPDKGQTPEPKLVLSVTDRTIDFPGPDEVKDTPEWARTTGSKRAPAVDSCYQPMLLIPMPEITGQMTAAAYQQMEEGPPWFQLIEGELVQDPSPNVSHQVISGYLHYLLETHCRPLSLGQIFAAPLDIWLSENTVLQPDLFFISNDRKQIIADGRVCGAPDLVIEILSPSSARRDLLQKRSIYARHGVREYWVVDPEQRQVGIIRLPGAEQESETIASAKQSFGSSLFPGLAVRVAEIFQNI